MTVRLVCVAFQVFIASVAKATPTVSNTTISWPDDGWYQVLNECNYSEVCSGTRSCAVVPGSYLIINHTTGERFAGITVNNDNNTSSPIVVTNDTISWPDDGWYQIQSALTYQSFCEGGASCTVADGRYVVINHTTGARFNDVIVGDTDTSLPATLTGELSGCLQTRRVIALNLNNLYVSSSCFYPVVVMLRQWRQRISTLNVISWISRCLIGNRVSFHFTTCAYPAAYRYTCADIFNRYRKSTVLFNLLLIVPVFGYPG